MDVFIEQLVRRKKEGKDVAVIVLILLGAVVLAAVLTYLSWWYLGMPEMALLFIIGIVYACYVLISNQNIEFEYIITNGELDVDRIIAQRKRKRVVTVRCRDFEDFGRYSAQKFASRRFSTRLMVASKKEGNGLYYAVFNHDTMGHVLMVFEPEERTRKTILPCLNRNISREGL